MANYMVSNLPVFGFVTSWCSNLEPASIAGRYLDLFALLHSDFVMLEKKTQLNKNKKEKWRNNK